MKVVGITGGMGAGKTTVCKIFASLDIPIYDADTRAKSLMISDKVLKSHLQSLLGKEAYYRNGKLNRKFISSKIFSEPALRNKVNALVHSAVAEDSHRWHTSQKSNLPFVIKEAALLVENGSYKNLDALIVVTAPESLRIQRIVKRSKLSIDEVKERLQSQLPEEEKIKLADFIITNDGQQSLVVQVWNIYRLLSHDTVASSK